MASSASELSYKIKNLKDEKMFLEAIDVFKNERANLSLCEIANDSYLLPSVIYCMRKQALFSVAIRCFKYFRQANGGTLKPNHWNALMWVYFDIFKHNKVQVFDYELLKECITEVQATKTEFSNTTLNAFFQHYNKYCKSLNNVQWQTVESILTILNKDILSAETTEVTLQLKGKEKIMELASNLEEYYVLLSKSLFENAKYDDCISCCDEVFEKIKKMHYKNHIWFKYRKALAMMKLLRYAEAHKLLIQIDRKESFWFVQKAISECLLFDGKKQEAQNMALQAFVNGKEMKYKGDLMLIISEIYKQLDEVENQQKYIILYSLMRESNQWKIDANIWQWMNKQNIKLTDYKYEILLKDLMFEAAQKTLQISDNEYCNKEMEVVIKKILHQNERGLDGFAEDSRATSFYFSVPATHKLFSAIVLGSRCKAILNRDEKNKKKSVRILVVM